MKIKPGVDSEDFLISSQLGVNVTWGCFTFTVSLVICFSGQECYTVANEGVFSPLAIFVNQEVGTASCRVISPR